MRVFINNTEVNIFYGATLKETIMAYSKTSYKKLKSGYLAVYDRFGFRTEMDGPVFEGQQFFLKVAHLHAKNK